MGFFNFRIGVRLSNRPISVRSPCKLVLLIKKKLYLKDQSIAETFNVLSRTKAVRSNACRAAVCVAEKQWSVLREA